MSCYINGIVALKTNEKNLSCENFFWWIWCNKLSTYWWQLSYSWTLMFRRSNVKNVLKIQCNKHILKINSRKNIGVALIFFDVFDYRKVCGSRGCPPRVKTSIGHYTPYSTNARRWVRGHLRCILSANGRRPRLVKDYIENISN